MKKFASDIIGADIMAFQEKARAGQVQNIVIDPENGNFVGLLFTFQREKKVIPISEVRSFGPSFVMVNDAESIADPDEVVRIKKAMDFDAKIIREKIETENGQKLGKVSNYTIDLKNLALDKLYVTPRIGINFLTNEIIIAAKQIVEIRKNKIIVSDSYAKAKKPAVSIATSPVTD